MTIRILLDYSLHSTYISGINCVVHYLDPAFEGGYLKEAQIRFAYVIEVHRRVFPCVIFCLADISIGNNFLIQGGSIEIDTLGQFMVLLVILVEWLCPANNLPWKNLGLWVIIGPKGSSKGKKCLIGGFRIQQRDFTTHVYYFLKPTWALFILTLWYVDAFIFVGILSDLNEIWNEHGIPRGIPWDDHCKLLAEGKVLPWSTFRQIIVRPWLQI